MYKPSHFLWFCGLVCLAGLALLSSDVAGEARSARAEAKSEVNSTQVDLMRDTAILFRSARKVISDNQSLINDASKGDKGLTPEAVVEAAQANYAAATGAALQEHEEGSLEHESQKAMLEAIAAVMDDAQALINEEGKGFKGFLPAIFAKQLADDFSRRMNDVMFIKLTAPKSYVRNRANRPDEWEHDVIEERFKLEGWVKGQDFSGRAERKGKVALRLILPEYYDESCLTCHGTPAGELDITGGKKEGGKLGELGGAISVGIFE